MIDRDKLKQAKADLEVGIAETVAENPEIGEDDIWHDLVVATAYDMDKDTAREWCRTQLGTIPHDLESWLGKEDFVR